MKGDKYAKPGRDRFHFVCPVCQTEHKRQGWSIAHMRTSQRFTCGCGQILIIRAVKVEARRA